MNKSDTQAKTEAQQVARIEPTNHTEPCECEILHTTCTFCRAKWDRDSYVEWRP